MQAHHHVVAARTLSDDVRVHARRQHLGGRRRHDPILEQCGPADVGTAKPCQHPQAWIVRVRAVRQAQWNHVRRDHPRVGIGVANEPVGGVDLADELRVAQAAFAGVAAGVVTDGVTFAKHPHEHVGMPCRVGTEHEEGGAASRVAQDVEQRVRGRSRAVVEGELDRPLGMSVRGNHGVTVSRWRPGGKTPPIPCRRIGGVQGKAQDAARRTARRRSLRRR